MTFSNTTRAGLTPESDFKMWIPKTASELAREAKSRTRRRVSLAIAAAAGIGYGVARCSVWPTPSAAGLAESLRWIAAGTAASAVLAVPFWWSRRPSKPTTRVCPQCNKVKTAEEGPHCSCGGTLMFLHEMKWVEVPAKPSNPSPKPTEAQPAAATTDLNADLHRQHLRKTGILITSIRKPDTAPPKADPDQESGAHSKRQR